MICFLDSLSITEPWEVAGLATDAESVKDNIAVPAGLALPADIASVGRTTMLWMACKHHLEETLTMSAK